MKPHISLQLCFLFAVVVVGGNCTTCKIQILVVKSGVTLKHTVCIGISGRTIDQRFFDINQILNRNAVDATNKDSLVDFSDIFKQGKLEMTHEPRKFQQDDDESIPAKVYVWVRQTNDLKNRVEPAWTEWALLADIQLSPTPTEIKYGRIYYKTFNENLFQFEKNLLRSVESLDGKYPVSVKSLVRENVPMFSPNPIVRLVLNGDLHIPSDLKYDVSTMEVDSWDNAFVFRMNCIPATCGLQDGWEEFFWKQHLEKNLYGLKIFLQLPEENNPVLCKRCIPLRFFFENKVLLGFELSLQTNKFRLEVEVHGVKFTNLLYAAVFVDHITNKLHARNDSATIAAFELLKNPTLKYNDRENGQLIQRTEIGSPSLWLRPGHGAEADNKGKTLSKIFIDGTKINWDMTLGNGYLEIPFSDV